jgi:hypothetical protein
MSHLVEGSHKKAQKSQKGSFMIFMRGVGGFGLQDALPKE